MRTPWSRCPLAGRCESCGDTADLAAYEADTLIGPLCLTLCRICAEDHCTPFFDAATATRRTLDHTEHLYPNGA
ncbi:hypothetical protein ABT369_30825 [Dactylosporangium sp. NPDC000244]|uniref:hypothetical protein n=1 Tax=Dactylosporangium sp. NPDC000244 TaxID=3154365 RepID=UPI00331721C3